MNDKWRLKLGPNSDDIDGYVNAIDIFRSNIREHLNLYERHFYGQHMPLALERFFWSKEIEEFKHLNTKENNELEKLCTTLFSFLVDDNYKHVSLKASKLLKGKKQIKIGNEYFNLLIKHSRDGGLLLYYYSLENDSSISIKAFVFNKKITSYHFCSKQVIDTIALGNGHYLGESLNFRTKLTKIKE